MENLDPNTATVQHVEKSSSDQLLRKFAEVDSDRDDKLSAKHLRLAKRVKRKGYGSVNGENNAIKSCNNSLADKKSLLVSASAPKPGSLIRRLGMSKAKIRAREIKNRSIITALEKTWRRTVEGASRVLMEKHYNQHKRLINDVY